MRIIRWFGAVIERAFVALLICTMIAGGMASADYLATQGTGTTFASVVIAAKHYMALVICDVTAGESQCAGVNGSGQLAIAGPVTNAGTFAVQAAQSGSWTATVVQGTGTNLHMVCDSGCSGSGGTSSAFGSAFPSNGTAI